MSSKKEKIKVSFGNNAENVTGSYVLIECGKANKKILVDYGLIQENTSLLQHYQINSKRPEFKPKDIDYIFLTHAHIDHSGRIPQLYNSGCKASLILPEGSTEIFKAMVSDSANICTRDAEELSKKLKKDYYPLYTIEDVERVTPYIKEYPVGEKIILDEDISFTLQYNAHIFKSVSITLWIKNGSQTRKIVITGDIGNLTHSQKYVEPFVPFENCNLLIGEATYADEKRSPSEGAREKDLEKLRASIFTICEEGGGKILIPTFAFGRSPNILSILYDIYHEDSNFKIPIIYASPLGIKLMQIFLEKLEETDREYLEKVLNWKNIKILDNFEQFSKEVEEKGPKIICCPSGMMTAGYSVFAATKILPVSSNMILFCGYSAEGTLSWKIKQKKTKPITIDGKALHARCQVGTLKSFSSHIQYQDLLKQYSSGDYDKIALVHSCQDEKIVFGRALQEMIAKKNKTSKVICVTKGTTINL